MNSHCLNISSLGVRYRPGASLLAVWNMFAHWNSSAPRNKSDAARYRFGEARYKSVWNSSALAQYKLQQVQNRFESNSRYAQARCVLQCWSCSDSASRL